MIEHKLDIEELAVETFDPQPTIQVSLTTARAWTGCMSDCSECGAPCGQLAVGAVY